MRNKLGAEAELTGSTATMVVVDETEIGVANETCWVVNTHFTNVYAPIYVCLPGLRSLGPIVFVGFVGVCAHKRGKHIFRH